MDVRKMTSAETAYVLGVGYRTLSAYRDAGIPHVKEKGAYLFDGQAAVRWFIDRLNTPDEDEESTLSGSPKDRALAKKYTAEANLRQIELAEKKGTVLASQTVTDQWRTMGMMLAKRFSAVEKAYGTEVGNAIRKCLEESFEDLKKSDVYKAAVAGDFEAQEELEDDTVVEVTTL